MTLPELRDYETPPRSKIIYQENTDKGMARNSLLLFRVQDRIDGVMVMNQTAAGIALHEGVSPSLRLSNLGLAEAQFTNGTAEGKRMEFELHGYAMPYPRAGLWGDPPLR